MCRQTAAEAAAEASRPPRPEEALADAWEVPTGLPDLPDLLSLSLAEIRELDHPVLAGVLAELRARMDRPTETLWGFSQGPANPPTGEPEPDKPSSNTFSPLTD